MKAAVLGYGNIGSGVVQVLFENAELIAKKAGVPIEVKYILDLREFPGDPHEDLLVHDIAPIIADPEVEIVVETMGGTTFAYNFVKQALEAGKHVATSNKALVAKYGSELLTIAAEKNINFLFEASVGGGIPIIRPLNLCITSDDVDEITGILNGTTNYMLTNMQENGSDYDEILKKAQDLGYAERNPEADVEGYDAGRKIAILCSLVFDKFVNFEDIHIEGITKITAEDMLYAEKLGRTIKLFATGKKVDGKVFAMVSPVMVAKSHPLAGVSGVMNAIFVRGDVIGDLMFYGAGAGKLPTASAVVADMVEAARNPHRTVSRGWADETLALADFGDSVRKFIVRMEGTPEESYDKVSGLFGDVVTIELEDLDEYAFITAPVTEREMEEKLQELTGVKNRIRLED